MKTGQRRGLDSVEEASVSSDAAWILKLLFMLSHASVSLLNYRKRHRLTSSLTIGELARTHGETWLRPFFMQLSTVARKATDDNDATSQGTCWQVSSPLYIYKMSMELIVCLKPLDLAISIHVFFRTRRKIDGK